MERSEAEGALADIWAAMDAWWTRTSVVKGIIGDDVTGFCTMGAWGRATGLGAHSSDELTEAFRQSHAASQQVLFPTWEQAVTVESFNDHEDTSAEDIKLTAKHAVFNMTDFMEFGE